MTSSGRAVRLITIEDRFDLRGWGLVLSPDVDDSLVDLFVGATHRAEAVRPDGTRIQVEIWVGWTHLNPIGFRCQASAKSATKADLPIGTELWCTPPAPEPS